jgi:hypothetical protein
LYIQRFLHFNGNRKEPYKTDENYDRFWIIRNISDKLTTQETNGLESEARSSAILRHIYIKHVSVFRQRQERASATVTAVHATVSGHITRTGSLGQKLCRDSWFLLLIYLMTYI